MHKRIAVTPALPECYMDFVLPKNISLGGSSHGRENIRPLHELFGYSAAHVGLIYVHNEVLNAVTFVK